MPHWLKLNEALAFSSQWDQGDQQNGGLSSAQGPRGEEQTRKSRGRQLRAGAVQRDNNCSTQSPCGGAIRNTRANTSLGEHSFQGKRGCRRGTQKRGQLTHKHSCAGPAQSSGQPSNLSPSATGGDAGGQEQPSQGQFSYPELSLPAQGWQWLHSQTTQSTSRAVKGSAAAQLWCTTGTGEFWRAVFPWWGAGEGWQRHRQVPGGGKEGAKEDTSENNGGD